MVRPKKKRCVRGTPASAFYKPQGTALHELQGITLTMEGFEAIRLVDAENVSRVEAAAMMDVSQPTLCRILAEARSTVAKALANGWALRIEGGNYEIIDKDAGDRCRAGHGRGGGKRHKKIQRRRKENMINRQGRSFLNNRELTEKENGPIE